MLIKKTSTSDISENEVTPENIYKDRRKIIKSLGFLGAGALLSGQSQQAHAISWFKDKDEEKSALKALKYQADEPFTEALTPEAKITSHNNFYEFGTRKTDPKQYEGMLTVNPWQLNVDGLCANPFKLNYEDLFSKYPLQERIYRMRCVEAWSMVIPWVGIPLADVIKQAQPNGQAKFVAFETLYRPEEMPGQKSRFAGGGIQYPYVEGLRIDEAMNPLTLLAVGLYGKELPTQNGAPIRLVVPWKYGFKSIKSITRIKLVNQKPPTTWNLSAPQEYGFYANVNPKVDHPRWSQAQERRLGSGGLFSQNYIPTLPFNGYGEQVAHMYKDMDLAKFY
ncbi:protein-methionine-sulfoxide reductase catalytic subunit MsrP [Catenovulum sp. SM1970]|uniref:protein-methionine-sulfoxide reductase catalytic subunit MsrP n=1 Tax=Marinifaba aquimaris TaxID=2741323 RepID=UPI001573CAE2|nr:protein-methionine-sulfoxide reductase catalytic subunit MsrP [Marinifaba aquimaris]NTS76638.1 protein-methionine-sulfoxide reductase catalytic subunit MsrP [Marinifaba aquimaris]